MPINPVQKSTQFPATLKEDTLEEYAAFHQKRLEETVAVVQQLHLPPGPVLDIGASPLSSRLPGLWQGREVHVLDPDENWAERFRSTPVHFHRGSLLDEGLPFKEGTFAITVAAEVFEHLPECPMHLLPRLAQVTALGGIVAVTVPNQAQLGNRARLLLGHSILEAPARVYHRPWMGFGHLHEYTLEELRTDFRAPGLSLVALGALDPYVGGRFPGLISLMRWLRLTGWRQVLYALFRRTPETESLAPESLA